MRGKNIKILSVIVFWLFCLLMATPLLASEAELEIPVLNDAQNTILMLGLIICILGMLFGAYEYKKVKSFPAHKSMLDVADVIFQTCKTYLLQQGKLLIVLEVFIGVCIAYYFGFLQHMEAGGVILILIWSVIGILGSYGVAWFGIRMNTLANSRMAFASLEGKPLKLLDIPLRAGMSIGVLLVCVELIMMLIILVFMPRSYAGACFIGFAIGESLGASALRICGGIFTKIADIGSDLMKIVFNIKEDDPRNPGVIADCTGDNAGDSVGPTADGFETYGVTGVALISFIVLGVFAQFRAELITWIFVMRILMIITSIVAFQFNKAVTASRYGTPGKKMDFEVPLTMLVWFTSILSIIVTFAASYWQIGHLPNNLWFNLSIIISCGTVAAALIPELVKVFTSSKSIHCREVVTSAREGRGLPGHPVGIRGRQFQRLLAGDGHFCFDVDRLFRQPERPGQVHGILLHLRLRPGGLRVPGDGAGHHRGGQLRSGDRQRPVDLRALPHREHPQRGKRNPEPIRVQAQF